jgi:hypothetical protein
MMMETNDNNTVKSFIEEITTTRSFATLTPHNYEKNIYNAQITFSSYVELLLTVRDLLKISLHTLYNDELENSGRIKDPSFHVVSVLEIAVQLLPCCEAEALDECHKLFLALVKEKNNVQR